MDKVLQDKKKNYRNKMKKMHKELVKMAKEFGVWDYGYMVNIILQMVKMYHSLYSDRDLVIFDTSEKFYPGYDEVIKALNRCQEIVDILEKNPVEYVDKGCITKGEPNTYALFKELLELISEHMYCWWE